MKKKSKVEIRRFYSSIFDEKFLLTKLNKDKIENILELSHNDIMIILDALKRYELSLETEPSPSNIIYIAMTYNLSNLLYKIINLLFKQKKVK